MPQIQKKSEMWLSLLADGAPPLLPETAQICKALGCFDVAQSPHRGPAGPCCFYRELSQYDCSRTLAQGKQRLKSPGTAGSDQVTGLVWIQLGISPFWAKLQQTLHEPPMFWGPGRCLSWVQLDPNTLHLVMEDGTWGSIGASLQQLGPTKLAQNHS